MNEEYSRIIGMMASHYDLYGEVPPIYSDEFREAVIQKLTKEESGMQYTHYKYMPLIERDYKFPELLGLLSSYIRADGDIDKENKIAKKIADTLVENVSLYFREDIEDDIKRECHRKYGSINDNNIYAGHTDYVEI